jgi:hypothetical protein
MGFLGHIADTTINLVTSPLRAVGHAASAAFNVGATVLSASPPGLLFSAVTHSGDFTANARKHGSEALNHTVKAGAATVQANLAAVGIAAAPFTFGASLVPAFAVASAETAATQDGFFQKVLLHQPGETKAPAQK